MLSILIATEKINGVKAIIGNSCNNQGTKCYNTIIWQKEKFWKQCHAILWWELFDLIITKLSNVYVNLIIFAITGVSQSTNLNNTFLYDNVLLKNWTIHAWINN